jgi:uncharacterized protein YecT (DUF1311 family)
LTACRPWTEAVHTMSKKSFVFLVLFTVGCLGARPSAIAQHVDCGKAESTAEQAACADRELSAAEQELKEAFGNALDQYIPSADQKRQTAALPRYDRDRQVQWEQRMRRDLNLSQKAWLSYRQSACGTVADMYDGGTITAIAVPLCKAEMTRARAKFLHDYFGDER